MGDSVQVWHLARDGHQHQVEASGSPSHHVRWLVDDQVVAEKRTWEDKFTLTPDEPDEPDGLGLGLVVLRFSGLGKPRRATLYDVGEQAEALTGLGGVDLVPEAGSPAAAYEDKVRLHPTLYALIATAGGVAKVVVPLLLGLFVIRFAIDIDWPELPLPDLPRPNLPDIPWPNLPDLPLPDLPDLRPPDWVRWVLDKAKYVWPIVLAYVLARAEIRRRREQDRKRRAADAPPEETP